LALIPKNPNTTSERAAERRAAQEQVFLREVDDALREDSTMQMVRRYGLPIGAGVVLVLAGLGGWLGWTNYTASVAGKKGEAFTIALDQVEAGRYDAAKAGLDQVVAGGGAGYAGSARLVEAGIALDRKKPDDAAKIFDAVAADGSVPQAYRDLATVRGIAAKFDSLPPQQVIDRLKPLAVPGNPWFGSAGEMLAIAEMKIGRRAEAGATFAQMAKDTGVPDTLRRRARQLAVQLGSDPGDDASAAAQALAQ
jgi:hypothetical protein